MQAWGMHASLGHACKLGACMQAWGMHASLGHACKLGACMQAWGMHASLGHACKLGACMQAWGSLLTHTHTHTHYTYTYTKSQMIQVPSELEVTHYKYTERRNVELNRYTPFWKLMVCFYQHFNFVTSASYKP